MLTALRRYMVPLVLIAVFLFALLIVLEWGLDFTSRQRFGDAFAGRINGEEISWTQYNQALNQLTGQAAQQFDGDIPEGTLRQLEEQAWEQLVQAVLFRQEAERRDIVVTDKDLLFYLRFQPPQFLQTQQVFLDENGNFDYQRYQTALADPQFAALWNEIDPFLREEIRSQKLQQSIINTAQVTDLEVRQRFIDSLEQVTIGVINVPYSRYIPALTNFSDEERESFYRENPENYRLERRAKAHIVLLDQSPTEFDWEVAQKRTQDIYDSLQSGSDFADLAALYSEDATNRERGGALGWFDRGAMVSAFDSAVFAMDSGQISPPIRTEFGWHIIRHNGFQDADGTEQANADHILIRARLSADTFDRQIMQLTSFAERAREIGFLEAAAEMELFSQTTPFFYEGGSIGVVGQHPEALEFSFSESVGSVSRVMDSDAGNFVMGIAERREAGIAPFEEVAARVEQDLRRTRVTAVCADTAAAIYAAIQAGESMEAAARPFGLEYAEVAPFSRTSFVPGGIGRDPIAIGAAFGLQNPGDMTGVINHSSGSAIMVLVNRTTPDLTAYNDARDQIRQQILADRQQALFTDWYLSLREKSDITNNLRQLRESRAGTT